LQHTQRRKPRFYRSRATLREGDKNEGEDEEEDRHAAAVVVHDNDERRMMKKKRKKKRTRMDEERSDHRCMHNQQGRILSTHRGSSEDGASRTSSAELPTVTCLRFLISAK